MPLRLFPALPGLVYPVRKAPQWSTSSVRSVSGRKTTLAWYSYPYYRFEVAYSFLRADDVNKEWQELVAFYNLANGAANLFRFNDPDDDTVTAGQFGTGDGATTEFQLLRTLTGTSFSWTDPVFDVDVTEIKAAGVTVNPADYTVGDTGIVTFDAAPAAGAALTWTGTFDWLVRFDEDVATFEQFAQSFWELKTLKFSSEKL